MKLVRFGPIGREKPGIEINGVRKDVSAHFCDYDHDFFIQDQKMELELAIGESPRYSRSRLGGTPQRKIKS